MQIMHEPRLITCMMQNRNDEDSIDIIGNLAQPHSTHMFVFHAL